MERALFRKLWGIFRKNKSDGHISQKKMKKFSMKSRKNETDVEYYQQERRTAS